MTRTELIDELMGDTVNYRPYCFDPINYQNFIFNQPECFSIKATGYPANSLLIGIPTESKRMSKDDAIDHLRAGGEFLVAKVLGVKVEDVRNCITVRTEIEFIDYWVKDLELSAEAQVEAIRKSPVGWLKFLKEVFRL